MKTEPLVSILTLVFNHRPYIGQTIHGVLNQTYHNWEWIILDDGSTDGTGEIIKGIKDSRIKYTFQEHGGVDHITKIYNKALMMCNGDLIALLDGDDYWPEYKLEVQVKRFNDPDVVLSYGECFLINPGGKKMAYIGLPKDPGIAGNNPKGEALKILLNERNCFITNPTAVVRKSDLSAIGGFLEAEGIGEDFITWVRLSLEGKFSAVPLCLGYHRKHLSSMTMSQDPVLYFDNETRFLREFILRYNEKLKNLGLSYDMDRLDKHWGEKKKYLHHDKALDMLMVGSLNDARIEFKKFFEEAHAVKSIKSKLIYTLTVLSSFLRLDLVNPLAHFKCRTKVFLKNLFKRFRTNY